MNRPALKKFLALPINPEETFQGGFFTMADILDVPAIPETRQMPTVLWRSVSSELVHAMPLLPHQQGNLDAFVDVMLQLCTEYDFPFRPARIQCNDRSMADGLSELLADCGTEVQFVDRIPEWDKVLQDLQQYTQSVFSSGPSLAESGASESQIRAFAEAAADFYRRELWDLLDDTDLIRIESPKPPRGLKYAVVLGAGSQTYGLGFYDDEEVHHALMSQEGDPLEMDICSLTFDSPADASPDDVVLWKELNLPLETGDAFPCMFSITEGVMRSPKPKELEFAALVLRALAATSEEELDSGQWNKSVEIMGKRKRCKLSIPNLLDPPNHQEWIRRGKMPDRRGHERMFSQVYEFIESHGNDMSIDELNEAISAKFTGPIDELPLPTNTPQERAEALCQEAVQSHGRRRIQLVRQALAEDPDHVEANILMAESERNPVRAIELFQHAKELGQAQLGHDFEELVGHFWSYHPTRPYMRACHGLAHALRDAGQMSEAVHEYQQMLRLNPNDNQGVRYELLPLLVACNRDDDAVHLMDQHREEAAFWKYMKALLEYRRRGNSPTAKKAMRSAFGANPYVVPELQSGGPPRSPDFYSLGSPEEALICIQEMEDAWEETEGFLEWMFSEHFTWERDRAKKLRDQKRKKRKAASKRGRGRK